MTTPDLALAALSAAAVALFVIAGVDLWIGARTERRRKRRG